MEILHTQVMEGVSLLELLRAAFVFGIAAFSIVRAAIFLEKIDQRLKEQAIAELNQVLNAENEKNKQILALLKQIELKLAEENKVQPNYNEES